MRHLRGNVHLIEATREGTRPFGYVAAVASLGPDGAFLVDPMVSRALAGKIAAALAARGAPVRYVANTHAHPDHTRGNVAFAGRATLLAHSAAADEMASSLRPMTWLPPTKPLPASAIPSETFERSRRLDFNGERITLRHLGAAHTAGDAFIFFEKARVVHVGDTLLGDGRGAVAAPISGGSFAGLENALSTLVAELPADAIVVGGHGPLGEVHAVGDLRRYRDALAAARRWVAGQGAARPTDEAFASARLPEWELWSRKLGPEKLLRAIWAVEGRP